MSDTSPSDRPPPPRFSLRARLVGAAALFLFGLTLGIYLEYDLVVGQLAVRCPPISPRIAALAAADYAKQAMVAPHVLDHPIEYSWGEQLVGMQGNVTLEIFVQPDGSVGEARLLHSSGFCPLDATALASVARWHYHPAARGGVPFGSWWMTAVAFRMPANVPLRSKAMAPKR